MLTWFRNLFSSVITVLQGMYVTLITMLKTFRRKRQTFTDIYAYPEVPIKVKPRYRGFHRFDLTTCIGCEKCAQACPVDCIYIEKVKSRGIRCVPTIGAAKHARKAVEMGADVLVCQGGEGGGHTGATPTWLLLAQVLDMDLGVPVVACGGFRDGRGLAAALTFGADGIGETAHVLKAHGHWLRIPVTAWRSDRPAPARR